MTRMNPYADAYLDPDAHESHSDRRTLVVGAAGALVAAALGGSARAPPTHLRPGLLLGRGSIPRSHTGSSRCSTT